MFVGTVFLGITGSEYERPRTICLCIGGVKRWWFRSILGCWLEC